MNDLGWIQTVSGRKVYPLALKPEDIDPFDIAYALAHQNRYLGHGGSYSVAEHSVLVSRMVPPQHALAGLLHDAAEAYLGDWSRPIKLALKRENPALAQWLYDLEDRVTQTIFERFGLPWPMPQEVIEADNAILAVEASELHFAGLRPEWSEWISEEQIREHRRAMRAGTARVMVCCHTPIDAKFWFMRRWHQLVGDGAITPSLFCRERGDRLAEKWEVAA